jgi:hypothetical protein
MKTTLAIIAALALTLNGCGKKAETPAPKTSQPTSTTPAAAGVTVTNVTLGSGIGPQKQVVNPSTTFARNDTIYASVDTNGTGSSTLNAKWTYRSNGQDVSVRDDSQSINANGPATSEFHVSKPDGWPTGEYKVEISSSGNPTATRTFTVR